MDRKGQLTNVAFGGAWSEQIADREALAAALDLLGAAAERAAHEDVRTDIEVVEALQRACQDHPKGGLLLMAWARGARLAVPGLRVAELGRIVELLVQGHAARINARGSGP